jgi:hypothetical protein
VGGSILSVVATGKSLIVLNIVTFVKNVMTGGSGIVKSGKPSHFHLPFLFERSEILGIEESYCFRSLALLLQTSSLSSEPRTSMLILRQ